MAKIVITNPQDLYTVQGELVTENYELGMIGWKNPNNFIAHDESFMKIDNLLNDINNNKYDKTGGQINGVVSVRGRDGQIKLETSANEPNFIEFIKDAGTSNPIRKGYFGYSTSHDKGLTIGNEASGKALELNDEGTLIYDGDVHFDGKIKADTLNTSVKDIVGAINENKNSIATVDNYTNGLAGDNVGSFPLSQATKGQIYRVPTTNKYVVCIENYTGTEINLPDTNFEELSVWDNQRKLSELFNYRGYQGVYLPDFTISGETTKEIARCEKGGLAFFSYFFFMGAEAGGSDWLEFFLDNKSIGLAISIDWGYALRKNALISGTLPFYAKKGGIITVKSYNGSTKDFRGCENVINYYGTDK